MDLRQLRYFVRIVEEGSFSRAARSLNVAQPALSLHVRRMEEALGVTLLLRGPRGVAPTEEGKLLLARARAVLADLDRTEEEIRNLGREPAGTVRLGFPGTISEMLSVPLVTRCRDRHPGIKIIVAEAMSGFVRDWLAARSVELGVVYLEPREDGLASEALLEEELVLLTPPGSAAERLVSLDAISGRTLILPSGAHGLRILLDGIFAERGIGFDPAIELDSYRNIKRLVEDGYGCSILPWHAVAEEERSGRLRISRFNDDAVWRTAYLAREATRPLSRATAVVADVLKDVVRELVGEARWPGARFPGAARRKP